MVAVYVVKLDELCRMQLATPLHSTYRSNGAPITPNLEHTVRLIHGSLGTRFFLLHLGADGRHMEKSDFAHDMW
jgi:hypothetical protein